MDSILSQSLSFSLSICMWVSECYACVCISVWTSKCETVCQIILNVCVEMNMCDFGLYLCAFVCLHPLTHWFVYICMWVCSASKYRTLLEQCCKTCDAVHDTLQRPRPTYSVSYTYACACVCTLERIFPIFFFLFHISQANALILRIKHRIMIHMFLNAKVYVNILLILISLKKKRNKYENSFCLFF